MYRIGEANAIRTGKGRTADRAIRLYPPPTVRNYRQSMWASTIRSLESISYNQNAGGNIRMSIRAALTTIESQLAYWQQEREAACRANDLERIVRCEKFIAQCELVIAALRQAQSNQEPLRKSM